MTINQFVKKQCYASCIDNPNDINNNIKINHNAEILRQIFYHDRLKEMKELFKQINFRYTKIKNDKIKRREQKEKILEKKEKILEQEKIKLKEEIEKDIQDDKEIVKAGFSSSSDSDNVPYKIIFNKKKPSRKQPWK